MENKKPIIIEVNGTKYPPILYSFSKKLLNLLILPNLKAS